MRSLACTLVLLLSGCSLWQTEPDLPSNNSRPAQIDRFYSEEPCKELRDLPEGPVTPEQILEVRKRDVAAHTECAQKVLGLQKIVKKLTEK